MKEQKYTESIPTFSDNRKLTKVWLKSDNTERVFIFENTNDTWGLWGDYFSDHEAEMCWCTNDMGGHFYDSEETAIKELKSSYPWAKEVEPMNI